MHESILCAIDFTESSLNAFRWSVQLAAGSKRPLTTLYSYRLLPQSHDEAIQDFRKKTEESARKRYAEWERKILTNTGIKGGFVTDIGFASDSIENHLRKNPVNLLIISNSVLDNISVHKGEQLPLFMKSINVPLLIVSDKVNHDFVTL